jgi:hypothetical protein
MKSRGDSIGSGGAAEVCPVGVEVLTTSLEQLLNVRAAAKYKHDSNLRTRMKNAHVARNIASEICTAYERARLALTVLSKCRS